MSSWHLFEACLPAIEAIVARVCRRARLYGADAEDFGSSVKLALLEDDCAILRRHDGRASAPAYLAVVIQRMLTDHRIRVLGKWHPSTEAVRLGPAAVLLETLLRRDRRPMEEAWPIVHAAHPQLSRADAERMAGRLPERLPRPRQVELEEHAEIAAHHSAEERLRESEARRLSSLTSRIVRETIAAFDLEDRSLLRFHFAAEMSIAEISRMMRLPQRPLYRRIEKLLSALRRALVGAGIDAADVREIVAQELNFGLHEEIEPVRPFFEDEGRPQTRTMQ